MRTTIQIHGARENNLRNVDVEIPRDKLVVVTGVSGSGKSSLAFDTLYAEGQRRLLASMSTFAKRFVGQLKKPDVDFVNGLSPVVSIDQKTVGSNPRSTVGTMTDISDYLRMLFATMGTSHCPLCREALAIRTPHQMMEHLLSLPRGTEVEVRAPVYKIHGEDYEYLFEQIRVNGYRRARIDGKPRDLGDHIELDEDEVHTVEAVVDSFVIGPGIEQQVVTSLEHGLKLGDGLLGFHIVKPKSPGREHQKFYDGFGCAKHRLVAGEMQAFQFTFNDPAGACPTCAGLGTAMRVHPALLVPDPKRSINEGAFVSAAVGNSPDSWGGRQLYSLAVHYGFSLDTPFQDLAEKHVQILLHGTGGELFEVAIPPKAKIGHQHAGKKMKYAGIVNHLEHHYRQYRKQGTSNAGMDEYLKKVMVEYDCPECGGARLKRARRLVTIGDRNLYEVGEMHLADLIDYLGVIEPTPKQRAIADTIVREVATRLELLVAIGLDYLSLNRRSATLSGGESQRIRLSSQIGSGLMGMLYVLDEPSIGLHPKDNVKMIETLERLRDLGNTVIVVEHDEDTIRAADHIVEIGPGPGVHGGKVVAEGSLKKLLKDDNSLTGQYLSGKKTIDVPRKRRPATGKSILIRGARQNNLKNLRVEIPLEQFVCITGASGSGKSSLIHGILQKRLYSLLHDSRVLAGDHDEFTGSEHVSDVIDIDQSPIGRSSRSNPATYIGFYDAIRTLFAETDAAKKCGFTASTFSFNVKGGRCEECTGEGTITTQLSFMPDVEVVCPTCKGARYNQETLEVKYQDKNIAEVLDLSVEDGVEFFANQPTIARKIAVLNELGLGYLKLGHPSTILSGGEAQRVKLAGELGKLKRGKHNVYILDEPTTGLHFADIGRLLESLNRLVDNGHSVVVIEHNLDVIKTADYVIDLGPEGGHKGGHLIACGTPEEVAACKASHTGKFLAELLDKKRRRSAGA
ncbi:excinuclease ABC subunit UvrA [Limnoglobus roseus]|uniref:UvrABC system protein A n=1 Tax=Limnoglobus roseus TaxID=2598579 RepID=A0A5C1ARU6_9BACT|nr:excinuclease ABC subunit UvrA [Limnoglobus roseus]QEL20813.1 excinuclease ABC subunit UvrA [Limnoglobus roseus]